MTLRTSDKRSSLAGPWGIPTVALATSSMASIIGSGVCKVITVLAPLLTGNVNKGLAKDSGGLRSPQVRPMTQLRCLN